MRPGGQAGYNECGITRWVRNSNHARWGRSTILTKKGFKKLLAGTLLSAVVVGSYGHGFTSPVQAASTQSVTTGVANSNVYMRSQPSTSGKVVARVYKGDNVRILASNSSWYRIVDSKGNQGYASAKYITAQRTSSGSGSSGSKAPATNAAVERVINAGMKYLGTPYEFGSNRSSTRTFDCSDFVRRAFIEGAGITLPSNSRTQGAWIKDKGTDVYRLSELKRGDLVFFMSYRGSSASAYAGVDKSKQRITHVAIYLGDGKLLHTYSKQSGGVLVGDFSSSWQHRFLFGGSVL
ncbi:glycoside hydrolase [Paenibacillus sp. 7541]|uniref:Glycoside hydrolase n=1 Tax=Paenibacillus campinasensis TaxID=66347 RepID=A0A268EQT7_9BACL|nr:SH3 domain-containing protein [Paenibacillus campinasensis]PAD75492.1 glycoside hydrolase [Paenibacillus campinasensis]PAK51478.1 glycoside hydrolase [Paenibacillus sp. 7541]